ncbi:MAG: PilZ domain-containing protein [Proteobacteria bacterium]|nr:PilZ domain-containing protein [Pseudomonadota bacterium]
MNDVSMSNQQPKLLIIDDDREITDFIERLTDDLDWLVLSINDSELIGSTCRAFIPDVIFLDLGLPGYRGPEIIHYLSDLGCNARIFLISGLDRMSLESYQAVGVGCDLNIVGALTKPFTGEDIYHALASQKFSSEIGNDTDGDHTETKSRLNIKTHTGEIDKPFHPSPKSNGAFKQGGNGGEALVNMSSVFEVGKEGLGKDVLEKHVTILLSDIRGFTEITEYYPAKDVVYMLNRYFEVMGNIIEEYGGSINKIMGDSLLVIFGLGETHPDDVQNALACAVAMQMAMTDCNKANQAASMPDLYMGIALNTGSVVASEIGSRHYKEYTIIGDAVNLTSRIEAHCLRGQILISENTYREARGFIEVGAPNTIEVKGLRGAVDLYELRSTNKPRYLQTPRRERRNSPRIPVSMPLIFQILNGKLVLKEKYQGEVLNISYNGLLIQSATHLAKSSEIKLSLALGMFSESATDVYATIIRTEDMDGKFCSSLEFTTISSDALMTIKQYVDNLVGDGL